MAKNWIEISKLAGENRAIFVCDDRSKATALARRSGDGRFLYVDRRMLLSFAPTHFREVEVPSAPQGSADLPVEGVEKRKPTGKKSAGTPKPKSEPL
jgi:hypothetical protein